MLPELKNNKQKQNKMKKLLICLLLATSAQAQWNPVTGFILESDNVFSYYADDLPNALDKCTEAMQYNNVNLATIAIDEQHDPAINSHLYRKDEPGMVYLVYVAATRSGWVVRLIYREDEYFEIDEEYMTIVYEKE